MEFALVAPLVCILLLGGFQVAWALHCAASVRWSLETNARTLLMNPSTTADQLKTAMVSQLSGVADARNLTVSLVTDNTVPSARVLRASSVYQANLAIPMSPVQTLVFHAQTEVPSP